MLGIPRFRRSEHRYIVSPCGTVGCPYMGPDIKADRSTFLALLRSTLAEDGEGSRAILNTTDPRILLGVACQWFNTQGIAEHGRQELERRLAP
jgi:hypothetical protein